MRTAEFIVYSHYEGGDLLVAVCFRATGANFRLMFEPWSDAMVNAVLMNGVFVYGIEGMFPFGGSDAWVSAFNPRTQKSKTLDGYDALTGKGPASAYERRVTALVANRAGSIAWIGGWFRRGKFAAGEVHILDAPKPRRVASGARIAPHSLRLCGRRVCWVQAGTKRSVRLGMTPHWPSRRPRI